MVWERNDGSANTKDHGWVNLTVSVSIEFTLVLKVRNVHGNHCGLLFFNIKILTESILECVVKIERVSTSALQTLNMSFLKQN